MPWGLPYAPSVWPVSRMRHARLGQMDYGLSEGAAVPARRGVASQTSIKWAAPSKPRCSPAQRKRL